MAESRMQRYEDDESPDPPPLPPYVPLGRNMILNPSGITSGTATTPKRGMVQQVRKEWLVLEDGALAYQLQDEEIAAHYGHNREKNRIVRQDAPHARMEQEDELKQALAMQQYQQRLREQQEREDEELARRIAEQLKKDEEMQLKVRQSQDEQLATLLQNAAITKATRKSTSPISTGSTCSSPRMMDLNQPMSEEEAREWQERCDAEMARKLQEEEEEEAKFRRDVTDLSKKLAIEARDRELAQTLQEKEKARLLKAKEKARLKAAKKEQERLLETQNIAINIDPTWRRYQDNVPLPITDLDFPPTVQSVPSGQRREPVEPVDKPKPSPCSHQ